MTGAPLPTVVAQPGVSLRPRHVAGTGTYRSERPAIGVLLGWNEEGTALRVRRSEEPSVERWDARTGALLGTVDEPAPRLPGDVRGHEVIARSATMSLTRRHTKKRLEAWRDDLSLVATLKPPRRTHVEHASFADDGRAVLAALDDGSIVCWDLPSTALRWRSSPRPGNAVALASSAVDGAVYSLDRDGHLRAFAPDGTPGWSAFLGRSVIAGHAHGYRVVPSPDGALVAVGRPLLALRVFDAATGEERSTIDGHDGQVSCVALSADGGLVASGGWEQEVHVADVATGARLWTLETADDDLRSVAFVPERGALRTVGDFGSIQRWSLATGLLEERVELSERSLVREHASLDGSRLLLAHGDGLELWSDRGAERLVWSVAMSGNRTRGAGFDDRGGRVLACCSNRNWNDLRYQLEAYDAAKGEPLGVIRTLDGRFLALAETYDGLLCVVVTDGGLVVTEEWSGGRVRRVRESVRDLNRLLVSTDGRRMVGSDAREVRVWELGATPRRLARVDVAAAGDRVTALAVSADGSTVAIGTARGRVLVYAIEAS